MKNGHYVALTVLATAWSTAAMSAAPGFTNAATVATIYSGGGSLDMSMNGMNSPMSCSLPNNYRVKESTQSFTSIASLIITGFSTSKHVVFYVTGCDTDGSSLISSAVLQAQ